MEGDDKKFEEHYKKLKQLQPDPDVWSKIDTELWFEESVKPFIHNLPNHAAPDFAWRSIDSTIRHQKVSVKAWRVVKLVAGICLVLTISWGVNKIVGMNESNVMLYEGSRIESGYIPFYLGPDVKDPLIEIMNVCEKRKDICETPEMTELIKQLEQLNDELKTLNKLYPEHVSEGEFPELEKLKLKVDNTRDEIIKAIMIHIES